jgi:hypothetical protein
MPRYRAVRNAGAHPPEGMCDDLPGGEQVVECSEEVAIVLEGIMDPAWTLERIEEGCTPPLNKEV